MTRTANAMAQFRSIRNDMDEDGVGQVLDDADCALARIEDSGIGFVRGLYQRGKLLYWMLLDWWNEEYSFPWQVVAVSAAALAYFVMPFDAVPDAIPVAGWLDDAAVLAWAVAKLDSEIDEYVEAMEIDTSEFDMIYDVDDE